MSIILARYVAGAAASATSQSEYGADRRRSPHARIRPVQSGISAQSAEGLAAYLAAGLAVAILLWGTIIWIRKGTCHPIRRRSRARRSAAVPPRRNPRGDTGRSGPGCIPRAPPRRPLSHQSHPVQPLLRHPRRLWWDSVSSTSQSWTSLSRTSPSWTSPEQPCSAANGEAGTCTCASAAPTSTKPAPAAASPAARRGRRVRGLCRRPVRLSNTRGVRLYRKPHAAASSGAPSRTALSVSAARTLHGYDGDDHFGKCGVLPENRRLRERPLPLQGALAAGRAECRGANNLGLLYRDKGLAEDAVKEFQRASPSSPDIKRSE